MVYPPFVAVYPRDLVWFRDRKYFKDNGNIQFTSLQNTCCWIKIFTPSK